MPEDEIAATEAPSTRPLNAFQQMLRNYPRTVVKYPTAVLAALAPFALVLYYGYDGDRMLHATGYLFAVCAGIFLTDLAVNLFPKATNGWPVKQAAKETAVILGCMALGVLFLVIRFFGGWEEMAGIVKLALLPLILFAFPVVLALLYVFWFRYKPRELGVNSNYWWLVMVLHALVGGVAMLVAADKSHWQEGWVELGAIGMLTTGVLGAALSEEFVRMLLQTRLGKLLGNFGWGFVLATLLWAVMHVPVAMRNNPDKELPEMMLASLSVMPMGFLWGYLTHRTKSLVPAVLLHGFNLWGLQNL